MRQELKELTQEVKELVQEVKGIAIAKGLKTLRSEVGGQSDNLGYSLENKAIKNLPGILAKEGYTIKEDLQRKYLKVNGTIIEVNIIGKM